ncbi:MAG TPA: FtsW/RodA/SpoVE family cell cycle protein [Chloroflexota bacterium]|nr:FtsW/RodA/SpoVE family cell cycle protein [Chloroflexota bacterium]
MIERADSGLWRRRSTELGLLLIVITIYFVGLASLRLRATSLDPLSVVDIIFPLLLLASHVWLRLRLWQSDEIFLPITGFLSAVGILMVRRLEPDLVSAQTVWITIGTIALIATVSYPHLRRLRLYKYTLALAGLGLLAITAVAGHEAGGARLWLQFGPIRFQPTELLKLVLVLFRAGYLEERKEILARLGHRMGPFRIPPVGYLAPMALLWGFSLGMLVLQKDMGATLLLLGTAVLILFLATGRLSFVVGGLSLFALTVLVASQFPQWFGYIHRRMDAWLYPWADPQDHGYQIIQALVAFANGGVAGTGLGRGQPTLVPAVHTDFVFAAIGEELGLIIALPLLAVYLVFTLHGLAVANRMNDEFSTLLVAGLSVLLGLQTIIITAGNLQVLPLTGITLPFISYGGSSILANYLALGIMLRLSADARRR